MSEHAKGKNHQKGALPRKPRVKKPGRNRPAKGYRETGFRRGEWT